jgi:hypothetical protein
MAFLGRRIERVPRGNGRTVPMRLLFAPDHAKIVLEARDCAERRMFVLSHRLGIAGRPMALLPALAAVKANDIDASVYYGRTTGALSGIDGADLARQFAKEPLNVTSCGLSSAMRLTKPVISSFSGRSPMWGAPRAATSQWALSRRATKAPMQMME